MNFIINLPLSSGKGTAFNSILIIIDKYTKFVQYIPVKKTIIAEELIMIFKKYILTTFDVPNDIMSDKGSVFTSYFWSILCYYMKINKRLFMAFYSQINDQTEYQN